MSEPFCRLPEKTRQLYQHLLDISQSGKTTRPTSADICRMFDWRSEGSARNALQDLAGAGMITLSRLVGYAPAVRIVENGVILESGEASLSGGSDEVKVRRAIVLRDLGLSMQEAARRVCMNTNRLSQLLHDCGRHEIKRRTRTEAENPPSEAWPRPTMSVDAWPKSARFEDDRRATRAEPRWRPPLVQDIRHSYVGNAAEQCAL